MTIQAPRVRGNEPGEINRALQELAAACDARAASVALGEWRLLEVLASEAAAGFAFPTTKRVYSVPPFGSTTTTGVRVFAGGQTIVPHALGRPPKGVVVVGQAQAGSVFQLPLAGLTGDYRPERHVALEASGTGLYVVAVFG